MRIGILGTGTLASALGTVWAGAGHEIVVGGRSATKARDLADRLGETGRAGTLRDAAAFGDVVLLAVLWPGVEDALGAAGASDGVLAGKPLIDPTNAVEHGIGEILTPPGVSAAGRIADLAPESHVVKAFHLLPADTWSVPIPPTGTRPLVPLAGDGAAVRVVSRLVTDANATPMAFGGPSRYRQLEEVAGFVIAAAFSGSNPAAAVPAVNV
ncbi:NAD(P)-binding domain-containing protein [Nocardioidaceae bacterium SCSIO 66511]|nr:NAD(P)-binding domain-containing protein [Nocardioidaceae bacterium SCSIO 66511]